MFHVNNTKTHGQKNNTYSCIIDAKCYRDRINRALEVLVAMPLMQVQYFNGVNNNENLGITFDSIYKVCKYLGITFDSSYKVCKYPYGCPFQILTNMGYIQRRRKHTFKYYMQLLINGWPLSLAINGFFPAGHTESCRWALP